MTVLKDMPRDSRHDRRRGPKLDPAKRELVQWWAAEKRRRTKKEGASK